MPTPTDDGPDLLTVVAHMRAQPGKEQELLAALRSLVEPTTQEEGQVNYDLHQWVEDPALFYFYENWESGARLDAHLQSSHIAAAVARLPELVDGELTITRLRRVG